MKLSTRQRIITRSAELFNTYGYHGCSLSQIMAATGLQKGGIYNHFRNKDEIAVAAFNYNYERVIGRFKSRLAAASTPAEKIFTLIDVFVSFIDDPVVQGGGCPIFNTAMDSTNSHPELKEKAREAIRRLKKYIEIKLDEGVMAGEIEPSIDSKHMATLLVATMEGAIVMTRVEDSTQALELAASYVRTEFKKYLVNKK